MAGGGGERERVSTSIRISTRISIRGSLRSSLSGCPGGCQGRTSAEGNENNSQWDETHARKPKPNPKPGLKLRLGLLLMRMLMRMLVLMRVLVLIRPRPRPRSQFSVFSFQFSQKRKGPPKRALFSSRKTGSKSVDYDRCLFTILVISNMLTTALPKMSFSLASALMLRRFLESCRLFFLM